MIDRQPWPISCYSLALHLQTTYIGPKFSNSLLSFISGAYHLRALFKANLKEIMNAPASGATSTIPSEFDDEIDDAGLPSGYIWAYPCKLPSCSDYGKSWSLRSNFLLHLKEEAAHMAMAATPAARRAIEIEWRYVTDIHLPPRAPPHFRSREDPEEQNWRFSFKDNTGRVLTRIGTQREMDEELQRRGGGVRSEQN
jgi:hypothetical protein